MHTYSFHIYICPSSLSINKSTPRQLVRLLNIFPSYHDMAGSIARVPRKKTAKQKSSQVKANGKSKYAKQVTMRRINENIRASTRIRHTKLATRS